MQNPSSANEPVSDLPPRGEGVRSLNPTDLAAWLHARLESLADGWRSAIRGQASGMGELDDALLGSFTRELVRFLPWMVGPHRESVEPLWTKASELFGSVAAKRGLAAGEVIEEFQILRELVIRELYRDPPLGGRLPLSLREILRLNRGIDRGVTHASVGHTDALFFQFFEAEGVVAESQENLIREVLEQIRVLSEEVDQVVGHTRSAEDAG
jgi:hypothetical protein